MATEEEIMKYVNLPWSYNIVPEDDYFVVYVNELPRVASDGETIEKAIKNVKEAIYCAIEGMIDLDQEIPVPFDKSKFKGQIPYRTSSEIHYKLSMYAAQKHMSLNKTIDGFVRESLKREGIR